MNVGSALGFPVPTPSVKRTDVAKGKDDVDAPRSAQSSAQFAAFLTMIVSNNPKLRTDLIKQLPEDSAGLLDQLLASADETAGKGADGQSLGQMVSARVSANGEATRGQENHAIGKTLQDMPAAVDAMRYGWMKHGAPQTDEAPEAVEGIPVATEATPKADTAKSTTGTTEPKLTRAEINAINRARAAEVLGSLQNGGEAEFDNSGVNAASPQSRIPQSVLARVTSRKSASLEELLAVGDREAASVRVGLDNVLAKSGTDEGLKIAASHAASTALSAALAASANDVSTPVKDIEALDPELRSRLERVIARMKNEFGHDVTIVETARSQERQDTLFAQGRTTPGSVVTWTKDSLHTQGEAVDVIVDGSWNNPKGFTRLQQVAKEEGLNTLEMKDPGHLELPKESWTMNADVRVLNATSNTPAVTNGVARVATVARVAQVGVGMNVGPTQPEIPAVPQPTVSTNGAADLMSQPRESSGGANSQSSSESNSDQSSRKSSLKSSDKSDARPASSAYQETPTDMKSKFIGPVDETQRPSGAAAADAVDRVHDINALREQQGAKPLSQITLEVDGADGAKQQITVDVRGNAVGTHISADSTSADRMRMHVNELKTGLESRGLEADSVRISTQGVRATDSLDGAKHSSGAERDAMRLTGAGTSNGTSNGDQPAHQGARDKSSAARDWEDKQAARDEQRAQNRDAQGRGSGNQDRQRPQYQEKK